MAKMEIVDLLYNQKKEVELGQVTGSTPIPVESPVEFGSDIEVDGKVKLNSVEDLTDKEGNPLPIGGGGGTKLYKHTITMQASWQADTNKTIKGEIISPLSTTFTDDASFYNFVGTSIKIALMVVGLNKFIFGCIVDPTQSSNTKIIWCDKFAGFGDDINLEGIASIYDISTITDTVTEL